MVGSFVALTPRPPLPKKEWERGRLYPPAPYWGDRVEVKVYVVVGSHDKAKWPFCQDGGLVEVGVVGDCSTRVGLVLEEWDKRLTHGQKGIRMIKIKLIIDLL